MHAARRFLSVLATTVADTFHIIMTQVRRYCDQACDQTPLAVEGQGVHTLPSNTCAALAGAEFIFIGDTRMRQVAQAARMSRVPLLQPRCNGCATGVYRVGNGCATGVYRLCTGCVTCVSVLTGDSRMRHSTFWPPSRTCAASIYAASPTQATRTSTASRTRITGAYACIYVNHTHVCRCLYGCICLFDGRR